MPATSIYGTAKHVVTVKKHIKKWAYHRKGAKTGQKWYKRRVTRKVTQKVGKPLDKRFTFYHDDISWVKKAVRLMEREGLIPKRRWVDGKGRFGVDAKRFVTDKKYRESITTKGEWIDFTFVETPDSHNQQN